MNVHDAYAIEMERGRSVIYDAEDEECHVCHRVDEVRAGTCFDCKGLVRTDMIEVWEASNPANRWPYVWAGKPKDVTEEDLTWLQRLAEGI